MPYEEEEEDEGSGDEGSEQFDSDEESDSNVDSDRTAATARPHAPLLQCTPMRAEGVSVNGAIGQVRVNGASMKILNGAIVLCV